MSSISSAERLGIADLDIFSWVVRKGLLTLQGMSRFGMLYGMYV